MAENGGYSNKVGLAVESVTKSVPKDLCGRDVRWILSKLEKISGCPINWSV